MSWPEYVERHLTGRNQVELAALVGVSQTAVSRWLSGKQGVDGAQAVAFARAVGDTPLAALVAAGFLTAEEAKARPAPAPDYSRLKNDELLKLVRSRMREEGEGHDRPAATSGPGSGPDLTLVEAARRNPKRPRRGPKEQGPD